MNQRELDDVLQLILKEMTLEENGPLTPKEQLVAIGAKLVHGFLSDIKRIADASEED